MCPNLEIVPGVPMERIQKYFDRAKVLVNTSDFEGFSNTFVQAGLSRTAIVSLRVNPDNFLKKYNCGYVCDGSIEVLIRRVKELVYHQELCNLLGQNLRDYVMQYNDLAANTRQVKSLLEQVLQK